MANILGDFVDLAGLQQKLQATGHYNGAVDGLRGPATKAAIIAFLTDGPDTRLTEAHFIKAAAQLSVPVDYIRALHEVESSGTPFIDGRPVILPEPHIFAKLTAGRYNNSHPHLSSRSWNPKLYPGSQSGRYSMLADMIMLDPLAGFGAASYGGFQILGLHGSRLGRGNSMQFAWEEAQSEENQLNHFVAFIQNDAILWQALRKGDWVHVAKRYNGTAYYKNRYDVKLANAVRKWALRG